MEAPTTTQGQGRKLPKPNNIITIETSPTELFKWWCVILRPFVSLTNKEIEVVSNFLYQRHLLSKIISDSSILDTMVMSKETQNKVIEECKITQMHFYVIMSNLRKNNVIVDGKLNPKVIPNIREDDNGIFQLLMLFKNKSKA